MEQLSVFWFRRDLRIDDNVGLYHALKSGNKVLPIFIFDSEILEKLPSKKDARLEMIHTALGKLSDAMMENKCNVGMYHGKPKAVFEKLLEKYSVKKVFTNHDYEPYAKNRDEEIKNLLKKKGVAFETFKDQVIYEKSEITKDDGSPYRVYTPYSKKWIIRMRADGIPNYESEYNLENLAPIMQPQLELKDLGFEKTDRPYPKYVLNRAIIGNYEATRDYPALDQTSRTGCHLRFGTLSIRKMVSDAAMANNHTFLKELIWREFFMQILWHFPSTAKKSFKPKYERIEWLNNEDDFKKWCEGKTGYPLVDAGMRELNETGFMHNRVRMLTGSFLCKHLLVDWRWGEAYFAQKLLDYEQSSNVGNWQWVAGCGVDSSPYFRIFNPTQQMKKFDNKMRYIQKWVKEFQEPTYPKPIIEHKFARERCLKTYRAAVNS